MKIGKCIAEWNTTDIFSAQAEHIRENYKDYGYEELPDENKAFSKACEDTDLIGFEWDSFTEFLSEILRKKDRYHQGYWRAEVKNFGWRNLDGGKEFRAGNGVEFLREILPKTDCTFKVYHFGHGLAIQNWHHDSPTGNEWYHIFPVSNLKN